MPTHHLDTAVLRFERSGWTAQLFGPLQTLLQVTYDSFWSDEERTLLTRFNLHVQEPDGVVQLRFRYDFTLAVGDANHHIYVPTGRLSPSAAEHVTEGLLRCNFRLVDGTSDHGREVPDTLPGYVRVIRD
jgi:hypothetical protein